MGRFGAFFGHFGYPRVIPNECWKIDFLTLRDVSDTMVTHWYTWAMHADTPCIPVGTPGPLMEHQKGSKQVPSKKLEHDLGGYTPPWTPQGAQSPKHDFWDFWPAESPILGAISRKKWSSSEIPPNAPTKIDLLCQKTNIKNFTGAEKPGHSPPNLAELTNIAGMTVMPPSPPPATWFLEDPLPIFQNFNKKYLYWLPVNEVNKPNLPINWKSQIKVNIGKN